MVNVRLKAVKEMLNWQLQHFICLFLQHEQEKIHRAYFIDGDFLIRYYMGSGSMDFKCCEGTE